MDFSSLTKRLDSINKPAIHSLIVNFSGIDENFHANVKGAIKAGFDVGVYVYSQAINEEEALGERHKQEMRCRHLDSPTGGFICVRFMKFEFA